MDHEPSWASSSLTTTQAWDSELNMKVTAKNDFWPHPEIDKQQKPSLLEVENCNNTETSRPSFNIVWLYHGDGNTHPPVETSGADRYCRIYLREAFTECWKLRSAQKKMAYSSSKLQVGRRPENTIIKR